MLKDKTFRVFIIYMYIYIHVHFHSVHDCAPYTIRLFFFVFPCRGLCPKDKDTTSNTSTTGNQDNQTSGGHRPTTSTGRSRCRGTISDGSLVRLRNGPPCGPNSIVYSRSPCGPRVGKTMNIIEHGSLDPKTSVLVKVFKDDYRITSDDKRTNWNDFDSGSTRPPELDTNSNFNSLEVWKLSDVVFLDDSPAILGRVVTVDHPQAIVDISHSTNESGTLASSSNAKSTLKVFKVSELELCPIDYVEGSPPVQPRSQQEQATKKSSSEAKASHSRGGVSLHVAGTVQHHPVCILAPELSSTSSSSLSSLLHQRQGVAASSGAVIYGYTPLAVHTTDEGPTMLVERLSDSATFIVYSGHSSAGDGALASTSFVAVNCKDSKPNLFTVEEESVPALEGGFRADPLILSYDCPLKGTQLQRDGGDEKAVARKSDEAGSKVNMMPKVFKGKAKAGCDDTAMSTPIKSMEVESHESDDATANSTKSSLPQRRSSLKRKLDDKNRTTSTTTDDGSVTDSQLQPGEAVSDKSTTTATRPAEMMDPGSQLLHSSLNLCRPLVAKLNSQPLLIWDVNGMVCPLLDGLSLRPLPSSSHSSSGGKAISSGGNHNVPLPTMSYRCVTSRQYAVSKTQSVLVIALGKPFHKT